MVDREIADIKTYLATQFLHASPEWVEGCVEFFVSENTGRRYTPAELKDFVLQQWNLADLREMGQGGCLPPNLNSVIETTLQGKYALQVEWIRNIGHSAYTQLQEIRKQVNENVNVDAGSTLPQAWEPRPNRMLQLAMSDGKQSIKGIEYKPILTLKDPLLPGCKVLIIGPVECRRGVLLLQQHNFKIIGGEIDSLLIPNAIENILARSLNLELNPDPYKTQGDTEQNNLHQQPVALRSETILSSALNQNSIATPQPLPSTNSSRRISSSNIRNQVPIRNVPDMEYELLEDDLDNDIDAQLSALENGYHESRNNQENMNDVLEQQYLAQIEAMGFEEEELNAMTDSGVSSYIETSHLKKNNEHQDKNSSSLLDDDDDDFFLQLDALETHTKKQSNTNAFSGFKIDNKQNKQIEQTTKTKQGNKISVQKTSNTKPHCSNNQSKITSFLSKSNIESDISRTTQINKNLNETINIKKVKLNQTENKSKEKLIISNMLDSNTELKIRSNSDQRHVNENKLEEHKTLNVATSSTPIRTSSSPFIYLCQIKRPVKCQCVYRVKAFVLTLLSKLTLGKDGWHLIVKICDGSSNLDTRLSSDVLEKLIGCSRKEMKAMKQEIQKNPLLKEKVKEILQNVQQQLIGLNCLLDIEFQPNSDLPCIINFHEITREHHISLQARLKSINS